MRRPAFALVSLLALVTSAGAAAPDIPDGLWNRDDGLGGVRFSPCGPAMCGDVVWLKDPQGPAHVGERLLYDMRETAANTWEGRAHNPEDGRDYDGTLTVDGDHMTTKGCVLGFICRSVTLTRAP